MAELGRCAVHVEQRQRNNRALGGVLTGAGESCWPWTLERSGHVASWDRCLTLTEETTQMAIWSNVTLIMGNDVRNMTKGLWNCCRTKILLPWTRISWARRVYVTEKGVTSQVWTRELNGGDMGLFCITRQTETTVSLLDLQQWVWRTNCSVRDL